MSWAALTTLYEAAAAALAESDFDTAIRKAEQARLLIGTLPDVNRMLGAGGQEQLAWRNVAAINEFIAGCRRMKAEAIAAASGVQQTKICYGRPDNLDCY